MNVQHVEGTAGLEEVRDDPGPGVEVRQPADRADTRVDDVESFLEQIGQVVDVCADESDAQAQLVVQRPGEVDGGVGNVDTGRGRTESRPGHGVHPEVALQMQDRLAVDRADFRPLDVRQRDSARLEACYVVEPGRGVYRCAFVPVASGQLEAFGERRAVGGVTRRQGGS